MKDDIRTPGKTTIAPEVLLAITSLTTLSVEGVSQMSTTPGGVNKLLRKGHQNNGVHLDIKDNLVHATIYVILQDNVNIREVSKDIQKEVGRAISDMVGMEIGEIHIQIEDIDFD